MADDLLGSSSESGFESSSESVGEVSSEGLSASSSSSSEGGGGRRRRGGLGSRGAMKALTVEDLRAIPRR